MKTYDTEIIDLWWILFEDMSDILIINPQKKEIYVKINLLLKGIIVASRQHFDFEQAFCFPISMPVSFNDWNPD